MKPVAARDIVLSKGKKSGGKCRTKTHVMTPAIA